MTDILELRRRLLRLQDDLASLIALLPEEAVLLGRPQMSQRGISMLKLFEGYRSEAYRDSAGIWTIGYGHTGGVAQGDQISSLQAEELLREDIREAENTVYALGISLTQNQFDALVSLVYNAGPRAIGPTSTIGMALRRGDYDKAAEGFLLWNRAGGKVLAGLVKRREAEKALFEEQTL